MSAWLIVGLLALIGAAALLYAETRVIADYQAYDIDAKRRAWCRDLCRTYGIDENRCWRIKLRRGVIHFYVYDDPIQLDQYGNIAGTSITYRYPPPGGQEDTAGEVPPVPA